MKVSELIAALECEDPDMEVHFAYNYGDHWRTIVAPAIQRVSVEAVAHSDYHSMPRITDEDEDGALREVVVLR